MRLKTLELIKLVADGKMTAKEYEEELNKAVDEANKAVDEGNKEFANWVLQKCGGAIMEVRVELTRDDDTKSGYLWTTLLGPKEDIHEGMTCTATAIVDRKSPFAYAFDKMGQWLRTD